MRERVHLCYSRQQACMQQWPCPHAQWVHCMLLGVERAMPAPPSLTQALPTWDAQWEQRVAWGPQQVWKLRASRACMQVRDEVMGAIDEGDEGDDAGMGSD